MPSGRIIEAAEQDQSEGSDDGRPVSEVDDEFGPHEELLVEEEVLPVRPSVAVMRAGFVQLDSWDLRDLFRQRGCLLKSVPRFLWEFPNLSENCFGDSRRGKKERVPARARVEAALIVAKDDVAQTATWGFDGQGQVGGQVRRFRSWKVARLDFGKRQVLYRRSGGGGDETPPKEGCPNTMEKRAARALKLIQVGELSAGRHALEGADLADGNTATLRELRQRPANPRDPIPPVPVDGPTFNLDERVFCRNVRAARKGAAGGPCGMTNDHLRPLLDSTSDTHSLFRVAELMARGDLPPQAIEAIKLGRMTALRKESGGVRGIVSGEVMRRLTARTIAQQVGPAVKAATAPFQYALSTRAGCECIAHALQAVCELDPEATVTSIDGISAYDSISRRANAALQEVQGRLHPNERLFAYLDDVYVVSKPDRVGAIYTVLQEALWTHARIRVHGGKTHVWNLAGQKPDVCEAMQRIAEVSNPRAQVWRGSEVPSTKQGIKVLGTPLGHPDCVATHLEEMRRKHDVLLEAIPTVPDMQSAWLLLLHCASARANYLLLVVRPEWVDQFALSHDESMWSCLCTILRIPANAGHEHTKITSTLPLSLGGLGLRSARRTCGCILGQLGRCLPHDTGASSHCGRPDCLSSGRGS